MRKVRSGDDVIVITGKDKGKMGKVIRVINDERVLVENANLVKKHVKGNQLKGVAGEIIDREMPIHISNVALVNPTTNKADRVGFKFLNDGRKVRYFKSNGEVLDS